MITVNRCNGRKPIFTTQKHPAILNHQSGKTHHSDFKIMSKPKQIGYDIKASADTAEIRLIGEISWWRNSSDDFTRQIDDLISSGITKARLYVNCFGGSMFEAPEIVNQLKRFKGGVTCKIGAMAASAATYICAHFQTTASKNTLYMIHRPVGMAEGTAEEMESAIQLLNIIEDSAIKIYAAKTGLSETVIYNMMAATTWMNAETAKAKGFVDEIEAENAPIDDVDVPQNIADMVAKVNKGNGIYMTVNTPSIVTEIIKNNNPQPPTEMNKVKITAALAVAGIQMAVDATDLQLEMAVENLAKENVTLKATLDAQKKEVATAKAKMLIDQAIEQKKIGEVERELYMKSATADYDLTANMLGKIPAVVKASGNLGANGDPNEAEKSKWTFEDWQKKDNEGLLKMRADKPEQYKMLYKAHYGIECHI